MAINIGPSKNFMDKFNSSSKSVPSRNKKDDDKKTHGKSRLGKMMAKFKK